MWAAEEKETGELIGRVDLPYHADWPEGNKIEIAWQIDRSCWGRGLATEDALASLRYGFEETRLERIISLAVPRNLASRRVMEKARLSFRGERRWRDVALVWYAIDRRDWQSANP